MKKGIILFTINEYLGTAKKLDSALAKLATMGYEAVQSVIPDYLPEADYQSMLKNNGMDTVCVGYSFNEMLESREAVAKAARKAEAYHTNFVDVNTLPKNMRGSADGFHRYAEQISIVGRRLAEEGKKVLYHPHALEFISLGNGLKGMDILEQETDHDCVNFILDTHWVTCGGCDPATWIRKISRRMKVCHFKDYAIIDGAEVVEGLCKTFAPVGEGNIDWPSVVAACKDIGVEYVVVEQDKCQSDPMVCVETSIRNMIRFGV